MSLRCIESLALQQFPESLPFQQLHYEKQLALVFSELINRADVWMFEGRSRTRLTLKACQCCRVFSRFFGQELECDTAAKLDVLGAINQTHPAAAEPVENLIVRYDFPG